MVMSSSYIRWFETIRLEDVPLVGGKNASRGELDCALGDGGLKIPTCFALTVTSLMLTHCLRQRRGLACMRCWTIST